MFMKDFRKQNERYQRQQKHWKIYLWIASITVLTSLFLGAL